MHLVEQADLGQDSTPVHAQVGHSRTPTNAAGFSESALDTRSMLVIDMVLSLCHRRTASRDHPCPPQPRINAPCGVEISGDRVIVYTEGSSLAGDVVVGAFALDETMARAFARSTRYRPPAVLETLACKIHPAGLDFIPDLLGDRVHVFLPRLRRIEFGTLIPKGNHITVVIAGRGLSARDMDAFLAEPAVMDLLPGRRELRGYHKGAFPLGPAAGTSGHRYVIIGDAAGLVRPFKGKGINSALASGLGCAHAILEQGLSAEALGSVARGQSSLTRDLRYGRLVRGLVWLIERLDLTNSLIAVAEGSAALRQALFDCVSGRTTYREVVWRRSNLRWLPEAARRCVARVLRLWG